MPRFEKSSKKRRNKKYSDSESSCDEESIGSSDSYSEESEYEETEYETEEDDEETEYETEDEEEEDSEYETEEDSDASTPPPMTTRSRSKKNKKKRSEEDEDDDEDELDEREIQKIVSKLFPSRYSKQRNRKLKKKDIIKLENKFLEEDDTNKLAVIASSSTINIIKNFQLVEKRRVSLPDQIIRIFRCSNPACITNSKEHLESVIDVVDKDNLVLKCRYCSRFLDITQL